MPFLRAPWLSARFDLGSSLIKVKKHVMSHRRALLAERRGATIKLQVHGRSLEHDPEKWGPVFRKDHAQTKR